MCGFIVLVDHRKPIDPVDVGVKLHLMRHRGPDDSDVWVSSNRSVALGSCRLAIQDLSHAGRMPMADITGEVRIVYNGEIYNFLEIREELQGLGHRFISGSDTEVILNAYLQWGVDCLTRLEGMFAFAILDRRSTAGKSGKLFIARDRVGEKPLYFQLGEHNFVAASELKPILEQSDCSRQADLNALNSYLGLGYVSGSMSMVRGVQRLLPAYAAELNLDENRMRTWRYWKPPLLADQARFSSDELCVILKGLLLESVRKRLIADVPVGVLLSGGLDSSLIAAAACQVSSRPVRTFTVTFPEHPQFDEGAYAHRVANWCQAQHLELPIEGTLLPTIEHLSTHIDEPIADSSLLLSYLLAQVAKQHVTVALGGDGADELFGGYTTYSEVMGQHPSSNFGVRTPVSRLLRKIATYMPLGTPGRARLLSFSEDPIVHFVKRTLFLDAELRQALLKAYSARFSLLDPETHRCGLAPVGASHLLDSVTRIDFSSYLPDNILHKIDRASMAVSLELRAPYLDSRLMDFALSHVPPSFKASATGRKLALRLLGRTMLPRDFDFSRKQGFSIPTGLWREKRWHELCADVLGGPRRHMFDQDVINSWLTRARCSATVSAYLYPLVMLELWRQHNKIAFP